MNNSKNKNTPNPTYASTAHNNNATIDYQSKDRENAIENIKKTYPTKK